MILEDKKDHAQHARGSQGYYQRSEMKLS
jgi:hypothetical protein